MQAHEELRHQLESAVSKAVAAAQAQLCTVVEARDTALAAAEADVDELRRALSGRDERLVQLEAKLAAASPPTAATSSTISSQPGSNDQPLAPKIEGEIQGLRRELAAAHQRTHEVTQMYLTAVSGKPSAAIESIVNSASNSEEAWRASALNHARGYSSLPSLAPKGLVGLYKRPKVRGLFVLNFVAVHAAVCAIVMHSA